MTRALGLFLIGLVFGGGLGFTVAAGNGITFDGHSHGDPVAHDMAHDTPVDVLAVDAPQITMDLALDPVEGYNLQVQTRNFTFTPEAIGLENVLGGGHAHAYVNDEKLCRVYGEWMHIAHLPKGDVTVEVALYSNNHSPLTVAGQPIAASTRLIVD
ncbi:hypothetical protein [Sulfitobacter sp.]|uniref:hypothetical protein n=1 Tax=Sulfitobacter sp. TaxID=1903071 RepID=UPI0040590CD7